MTKRFATFDMLQWLSDEARRALLNAAKMRRLPAGCIIYSQADEGHEMFRLSAGTVRLSVTSEDGRELLYQLFAPGDCFGTSSVVDGEPRPQSAEAFDNVELQVFQRATINRLRMQFPEINDALLKLLSRHMRLLSDYFSGATLDQASLRLAERLMGIAETFGSQNEEGISLSTRISQSELASMVGTARQTVNRTLQKFQDMGWITIRNGTVIVIDLPALRVATLKSARLRDFTST